VTMASPFPAPGTGDEGHPHHEPTGISGLVYEEVPDATPMLGDVLVKVAACGITHTELDWSLWTCRAGHQRTSITPSRPSPTEEGRVRTLLPLRSVIDEAIVRTPYFAPDGPRRPGKTQLRTAVGCHLLARRKSGVQIPSPPPHHG
jgi:hypothetical protein